MPQWIYNIIPTEDQVRYALYPASSVATLVALLLMLLYIPSTVSTILKLRCGKIPSLHDGSFVKYRIASDSIYLNVGNMIYALVGGCILFFLLIAVFIFLCIWPTTQPFMQLLAAWLFSRPLASKSAGPTFSRHSIGTITHCTIGFVLPFRLSADSPLKFNSAFIPYFTTHNVKNAPGCRELG